MADIVLQSEIARVDRLYRGEYQRASELINDGKFVAADITITSSDVCKDQYYRLVAAQKKRQSQTAGK
ncbi:hypothetical protein HGA64_03725 [Candidatus Falkowbacteria bacterium]|nr:hypothetical protein [Candidatus Falkowbacteria bacterium]